MERTCVDCVIFDSCLSICLVSRRQILMARLCNLLSACKRRCLPLNPSIKWSESSCGACLHSRSNSPVLFFSISFKIVYIALKFWVAFLCSCTSKGMCLPQRAALNVGSVRCSCRALLYPRANMLLPRPKIVHQWCFSLELRFWAWLKFCKASRSSSFGT